jgi:hypothetical protein
MAKKQKVNKSQAVRDYLKTHRKAMSGEIAAALNKKGIEITPGHVANIKTQINKARASKKAVVAEPVACVPESPAIAESQQTAKAVATVALEHVKAVSLATRTLGGSVRLHELLGLIKEVGGLKKFKDLLEAISGSEVDEIPF